MSNYMNYEKLDNIKNRIVNLPMSVDGTDFEALYGDISNQWRDKAYKLQIRRMRKLKHPVS